MDYNIHSTFHGREDVYSPKEHLWLLVSKLVIWVYFETFCKPQRWWKHLNLLSFLVFDSVEHQLIRGTTHRTIAFNIGTPKISSYISQGNWKELHPSSRGIPSHHPAIYVYASGWNGLLAADILEPKPKKGFLSIYLKILRAEPTSNLFAMCYLHDHQLAHNRKKER